MRDKVVNLDMIVTLTFEILRRILSVTQKIMTNWTSNENNKTFWDCFSPEVLNGVEAENNMNFSEDGKFGNLDIHLIQ